MAVSHQDHPTISTSRRELLHHDCKLLLHDVSPLTESNLTTVARSLCPQLPSSSPHFHYSSPRSPVLSDYASVSSYKSDIKFENRRMLEFHSAVRFCFTLQFQLMDDYHPCYGGDSSYPCSIRVMGDKATARDTMKNAESIEEGIKLADEIGYPVMIKATAGGGGLRMRLAKEHDEFVKLLQQPQSEAAAAFGIDGVYLEKYIQNPRHIEFQFLADKYGNVVHFGERDCSIQRRNQKLLEEAPSPALTPELKKAKGDAAVAASTGYIGVGTVEFLLDERVEHPVAGMIYLVDLIEEQIGVAMGAKLCYTQDDIVLRGHSMECRISAEDALKSFRHGPGPFVRTDSHVYTDYVVPPSYDSLLGKVQVCKTKPRNTIPFKQSQLTVLMVYFRSNPLPRLLITSWLLLMLS
ncbi:hypothetical protein L1887_34497 [Cichorium endivia]|nr:hypothetical protein L1887_34497 [Cichorium endivia]